MLYLAPTGHLLLLMIFLSNRSGLHPQPKIFEHAALLPLTVTISVTNGEVSKAVHSRDVRLPFGSSDRRSRFCYPQPLVLPQLRHL